jgi:CubicO group peptidase (beta-lactamase class C family)
MNKRIQLVAILGIVLCVVSGIVWGEEAAAEEPGEPTMGSQEVAELEAFVDGIMYAHMKDNDIVGATFAMFDEGEIVFKKGYGYSDFEKKTPVSPDTTMFRPGSVSKLFTWTAVMQLYEQGKIDLDADVNTYLTEFKIPDTFPEPITMNHLMSHSPGFEEIMGIWARELDEMVPLGEQLKKKLPERIWPAGTVTAYSNYGTSLAGYIVEIVSGMSFDDYVEKNIFEPLGMEHSTFRQPLPAHLEQHMSKGYRHENGEYVEQEFELVNGIEPAGSASASAVDMAKFGITHLQKGRYGDVRILKEETAELMHTRHFSHHPKVWGNAHGFWEHDLNGQRIIEHGGDTIWFHSFFVLLPERNAGFFMSYNSSGGAGFQRETLLQALLDRYVPVSPVEPLTPPADFKERAARFTGAYTMNRTPRSTYAKIMRLVATVSVAATDEGTLMVNLPMGMGALQLVEIEPLLFRNVDGPELFAFREDDAGRITHAFMGQMPHMAVEKLAWYEVPSFNLVLLVFCVVLFLTALRWPCRAITSKICKTKIEEQSGSSAARWVAGLMCAVNLVFLLWFLIIHANAMEEMIYGYPSGIGAVLVLPLISVLFLLGSIYYLVQAWRQKMWSGCARVHFTLVVVAGLCFAWFLNFWNLIGFKL